jgi:hypothetical protein
LSLLTGYVSAQFHLKHDDFFETVRDLNVLPQSKWQELARFSPGEMQGKAIKKLPGAKSKFQWEPDHSPMDAGFAEEGLPKNEGEGFQSCSLIYHLTQLMKGERSIRKSHHQEQLLMELPLAQGGNPIPQNAS